MKAILEFNLPEEQALFDLAIRGAAYRDALENMRDRLRDTLKYNAMELDERQIELIEKVQKEFYNILGKMDINDL